MLIDIPTIRCINLSKSVDRMQHISKVFDSVKRIEAINGMIYSDGTFNSKGVPNWSFLPNNVNCSYFKMFPTTFGCNLSHIKSWIDFLDSNEEWSIVIEDDTEPVISLHKLEIPDDCDFYYLIGSNHPGRRLMLYNDGKVKFTRTLAAYLLSRKAAYLAIEAMEEGHYFQTDWQVPFRIFESMQGCKVPQPKWKLNLPRIKAYGPINSIIQHSKFSKISTFTKDGTKKWIPTNLL